MALKNVKTKPEVKRDGCEDNAMDRLFLFVMMGCVYVQGSQQHSCYSWIHRAPDNFCQLCVIVLSLNTLQVVYEASFGSQEKTPPTHGLATHKTESFLRIKGKRKREVFRYSAKAEYAWFDVERPERFLFTV